MASNTFFFLLVNLCLSVCQAAPSGDTDNIIIPEECMNNPGLCHIKPEGYDKLQEKINSLLPKSLIGDSTEREGTVEQFDNDPKGCPTTTSSLPMYLNTNGTQYDIIVNTDRLYQQVTTVRCATHKYSPDDQYQCFKKLEFNSAIKTSCVQSYTNIYLYVYVPSKQKIVKKPYTIPTCCSCHIEKNI